MAVCRNDPLDSVLPATLDPAQSLLLAGAHLARPSQPGLCSQRGLSPASAAASQPGPDKPLRGTTVLEVACGEKENHTLQSGPLLFNLDPGIPSKH